MKKYKAAIFINGCFWHQHQNCSTSHAPKTRSEFWQKKFTRNMVRDQKTLYHLKTLGWRVAIIWECGLAKKQFGNTLERLALWLKCGGEYLEIPVYDEFTEQ
jgi:DNA mismatch endonuclease, patch repair protein